MDATKNIAPESQQQSYGAQMSALRAKLAGRPYCQAVKDMLPELTKATIHGAVNGRNENKLVLAALKIVVHKLDSAEQQQQNRLTELTEQLGELEAVA